MKRLTLEESREVAARVWGPARNLAEDAIRTLRVGVAEDVAGTGITLNELARLTAEIKALRAQDTTIVAAEPAPSTTALGNPRITQENPPSPPCRTAEGRAVKAPRVQRPGDEEEHR